MNAEQLGHRAGAFTGAGVSLASGAGPSSAKTAGNSRCAVGID